MDKTVKSVKNSLKFKASPKAGILSVRIGVKKYVLPVDVRILTGKDHLFLSFPSMTELFRVANKQIAVMNPDDDASAAHAELTPSRRRGRRRSAKAELPSDLANALKGIPEGYKLGYDASGNARLVRKRTRTK